MYMHIRVVYIQNNLDNININNNNIKILIQLSKLPLLYIRQYFCLVNINFIFVIFLISAIVMKNKVFNEKN